MRKNIILNKIQYIFAKRTKVAGKNLFIYKDGKFLWGNNQASLSALINAMTDTSDHDVMTEHDAFTCEECKKLLSNYVCGEIKDNVALIDGSGNTKEELEECANALKEQNNGKLKGAKIVNDDKIIEDWHAVIQEQIKAIPRG